VTVLLRKLHCMQIYIGKSRSTLQMDIELKQARVLIWKILLFLNIISLYTETLVPSFHKPLKTSSTKFFGLLSEPGGDFPCPVSSGRFRWMALRSFLRMLTVGVGIYGLSLRLECGKQYAFVIPEYCEHHFPGGWCHLKYFLAGNAGCFHCVDACFVSGW
jgi:hypothetical protein